MYIHTYIRNLTLYIQVHTYVCMFSIVPHRLINILGTIDNSKQKGVSQFKPIDRICLTIVRWFEIIEFG